ncbi:hypothetical protein THARTR1_00670 [Trichoderma harzianum]|uniref:Uncharacterized protein n=1 Tax=Trichoderma harzianum TaxID=5544 RepID=A0A2K0UPT3_TRIHA|nr:hypothetical protein THARTR1_00670 [Trichoderma harzianum]
MADPQSHEEVPEVPKNIIPHTSACQDSEIQQLNMSFLEEELRVKVADGEYIYYDERGKMSMTGAASFVDVSIEEPQFDTCILWGPGAEASVAKRLIESAPKVKHAAWITTHKVLSEMPANPTLTPAVIALLRSTIAKERECWEQLGALKTVTTYQSLLALDIEAIITSICSLAGITVVGEDSVTAAQSGLSDLYPNMLWLRRNHQLERIQNLYRQYSDDYHRDYFLSDIIDNFKGKWNPILEKLLPGRLVNKMERYVDKMQYLLDNDERYSPK